MVQSLLSLTLMFSVAADEATNPYSAYGGYGTQSNYGYQTFENYPKTVRSDQECQDLNWDSQCLCERQKKKIEWAKTQGQTLDQFNWSEIQSKQLVMIGDAHAMSNPDSILNLIKRSQSANGKQCVFFEMSSDVSGDQFLKLLKQRSGNAETDRLRRYYSKIAKGAIAMGFKPYMVDSPQNWGSSRSISDYNRETHMMEKIQSAFSSGKCDHAVFVVGKAHIAAEYYGVENLPTRLAKAGVSLTRLNPLQAPRAGRTNPNEEWNGICLNQTFTPNRAVIFENSGIKNDLVTPGFAPPLSTMRFANFDYTILFPESQFEQKPNSASQTGLGVRAKGTR